MAKLGRDRNKIEDENGETLNDLRIQKAKRRDGKTEYEIFYVITPKGRKKNLGNSDDLPAAIFAYRQWKSAQAGETVTVAEPMTGLGQSVTFNPAFSDGAFADRLKFPAKRFKATRTQPMGSLDRNLGTSGKRVEFAIIEIEMLTDRPFADALDISARASLIGKAPESITVLGTQTTTRGGG